MDSHLAERGFQNDSELYVGSSGASVRWWDYGYLLKITRIGGNFVFLRNKKTARITKAEWYTYAGRSVGRAETESTPPNHTALDVSAWGQ